LNRSLGSLPLLEGGETIGRPVVLITGCSSGIGFETALLLAQNGYRVFATLRNTKKASTLLAAAKGLPLEILRLDVDVPVSVRRAVGQVIRRAGRIDVLVNNAGWGAFGSVSEFTDDEMRAQFETNVLGPARVTRAVLPHMRRQGAGRVLHVGSLAGRMTFAGIGLYCASKHAIEAMTESMRLEVRPYGIEVAVIEPGHIRTTFKDNRRRAACFEDGRSAHQRALEAVLRFGNRPKGPGPKVVARKILSVLSSKTMAIRHPAGWDALLFPFASWFLPSVVYDRLMDAMYRRFTPKPTQSVVLPEGQRVALVTGASSGIGFATVLELARSGYKVYAGYRDPRKLLAMRRAFKGLSVSLIRLDVDRSASVRDAVRGLLRREGRLDALVNNAGFAMAGLWEDLSDKELSAQFETNVFGVLRVCREALPALRASRGRVVNIGSVSAFNATPMLGAYAASKHALRAITGALRMEEKPLGVLVSEVDPGLVRTSILEATRTPDVYRRGGSFLPEAYTHQQAMIERKMQRAEDVKVVAKKVAQILAEANPIAHHWVNRGSAFTHTLKWILPEIVWESLVAKHYPWSRLRST
jgi:NAD(P)-dependent dehydrogenase (short-subunit alcohol dehydrogenase family)